jgi:hypothetical protein
VTTQYIRNSTGEFLIFTGQAGEQSIEARYEDDSIWLSQKLMAELFAVKGYCWATNGSRMAAFLVGATLNGC